jgi:hypothetical protein
MENKFTSDMIVPSVNTERFFQNSPQFHNSYIVKSLYKDISLSFYERKMIEKYVNEELGFDRSNQLNFDSHLIKLIIDYSRYNSFH